MGLRQLQNPAAKRPLTDDEMDALERSTGSQQQQKPLSDQEMDTLSTNQPQAPGSNIPRNAPPENIDKYVLGAIEGLPLAGAVLGGAVGGGTGLLGGPAAPGTVPYGALVGAGAGGATGKALENYLKAKFYPELAPKTTKEQITQPLIEGALSVAGEGAGQVAGRLITKGASKLGGLLKAKPKINEAEIKAASERLGVPTTPGQLTESQSIRQAESALQQSPSIAGSSLRKTTDKIRQGLEKTAGKLVSKADPNLTRSAVGENVKAAITSKSAELIQPAQMVYQELDDAFADVVLNERIKTIAINRLKNSVFARRTGGTGGALEEIISTIKNAKTLKDAKEFSTALRDSLPTNASSEQRQFIGEGVRALQRLKEDALKSGVDKNGRLAYKRANKIWSNFFKKIEDVDLALGGRPSASPFEFLDKLNDTSAEDVAKKLFQTNNIKLIRNLKREFPEAAQELVTRKISEIERVSRAKDGVKTDPAKLLKNLEKIEPDVLREIFGENASQVIKDFRTVIGSFPEKAGPSGTPAGLRAFNIGAPLESTATNISDAIKLGVLRSRNFGGGVEGIMKGAGSPQLQRLLNQSLAHKLLGDKK